MNLFQALVLGLFQGLTEFLPVSSSGHLVIGQKILGIEEPQVFFDVLVHFGTLMAILIFFKKKAVSFFSQIKNLKIVFIASLPAFFAGLLLEPYLDFIFNSLTVVSSGLFLTSLFLFSTKFIKRKETKELTIGKSVFIGFFQSLALFPGVSRSGSTITAGLWQKIEKEDAFNFSFFLGIPAMVGALILQLPGLQVGKDQLLLGFAAMIIACFSGYFSLKALKKVVLKSKMYYFGIYCFLLGVLIFFI